MYTRLDWLRLPVKGEGMVGRFGDPRHLTQAPGWMSWAFIKPGGSGMRKGLGRKIRSSSLDMLVWRYFEPLKGRSWWMPRNVVVEPRGGVQGSTSVW